MAETTLPKITVAPASQPIGSPASLIEVQHLSLFYGAAQALKNISLAIGEKVVTAFLRSGESKVELIESADPEGVIAKFIAKKGEGLHHLAFEVEDIYAEDRKSVV